MKIRTMILIVLAAALVINTGVILAVTSSGVGQIGDVTSEVSAGELEESAGANLEDTAVSIADSLDRQLENYKDMVSTWASSPVLINTAKEAQAYSKEELFEMWSAEDRRSYTEADVAMGDGYPSNDLNEEASKYLGHQTHGPWAHFFITDNRGYVIAANGRTDDFDQGPNDWQLVLDDNQQPIFKKGEEGIEQWYKACKNSDDGFYTSDVEWNETTGSPTIAFASRLGGLSESEYLGQLKAVFNYKRFMGQFMLLQRNLNVHEISAINSDGAIMATAQTKLSTEKSHETIADTDIFQGISEGGKTGHLSGTDDDGDEVWVGYATSDETGHIVVISGRKESIERPIDAFVGDLTGRINAAGSSLITKIGIIGAVVLVAVLILAFLVIHARISKPTDKLTAAADRISKGDVQGLEIDVSGKDEIGRLGESFKGVKAAFDELMDQLSGK
ncbi:MAG: HAMP domain-containing protein [Dehalococcoidia bacterium]